MFVLTPNLCYEGFCEIVYTCEHIVVVFCIIIIVIIIIIIIIIVIINICACII